MKTAVVLIVLAFVLLALTGCVPGPNDLKGTTDAKGDVPGFWRGLWNGFIAPVTFIISLFNKNVQMYEVHNNGAWYNLGFLFGIMAISGGGAGGAASRRKRG